MHIECIFSFFSIHLTLKLFVWFKPMLRIHFICHIRIRLSILEEESEFRYANVYEINLLKKPFDVKLLKYRKIWNDQIHKKINKDPVHCIMYPDPFPTMIHNILATTRHYLNSQEVKHMHTFTIMLLGLQRRSMLL